MKKVLLVPLIACACSWLAACQSGSSSGSAAAYNNITYKGVNIAYTDQGTGDTTLLFVHGWCINQTYWNAQVKHFARHYRVVTMDLPGFGQSGKNQTQWNVYAFADDVSAVITQLKLHNVVLVGHSMAGDIVLQAAVSSPKQVIALVGVDNFQSVGVGPKLTAKDSLAYRQAIDSLKHHFKTVALAYVKQDLFAPATSEAVRKRVLYDVAHADTAIAAACMEQDDFAEAARLQQAGKRLYMINSDVHKTDTLGLQAHHLPYKLLTIHATGHYPMIEQPAIFNQLLAEVMADLAKQS